MLGRLALAPLLLTFGLGGTGVALANAGAAGAISADTKPALRAMVRLVPNSTVTSGYPVTLVMVWRFSSASDGCSSNRLSRDGAGGYCVEIDAGQWPHRCVVTTPRVLHHALLGEAAESCFQLSLAMGKP